MQQGIEPDNRMAIIIDIAFELTIPIIHVAVIIGVEIRRIITNAKEHFEKVGRVGPKRVIHYLTVVEIFKNICRRAVGVVGGV